MIGIWSDFRSQNLIQELTIFYCLHSYVFLSPIENFTRAEGFLKNGNCSGTVMSSATNETGEVVIGVWCLDFEYYCFEQKTIIYMGDKNIISSASPSIPVFIAPSPPSDVLGKEAPNSRDFW